MITTLNSGGAVLTFHEVDVKLNGKSVGKIKFVKDAGWIYFPKGDKIGGKSFLTLEDCQRSLA